jgi:6-phosphogluconolactonase (cycloisomerase 2 family)
MIRHVAVFGAILTLVGCSAGSQRSSMALPGLRQEAVAPRSPALAPMILVADFSGDAVLGFPIAAKGNPKPSVDIAGSKTGLGHADNIALDASKRIFVSIDDKTIGVYAATANGNVPRVRRIAGSKTGLSFPIGVTVDSKGYVYVADCGYGDVKVFKPGANGNVAPVRVIGLTTGCTIEEAVDSNDDLYVTSGDNIITEFSSFGQGNNLIKQITEAEKSPGVGIRSVAIDSHGNIYAGNLLAKDIRVFAASASGPANPIRTIGGSRAHLGAPTGLALDTKDKLYVTVCRYCHQGSGSDSVLVFAAGAKGNVTPLAVIAGKNTKLNAPTDLTIRE